MKKLRTIAAFFLAMLLLVSSTSFVIGIHLCGGEVQDFAFFSPAEECKKNESIPPCHPHSVPDCCEDETVVHSADEFSSHVTLAIDTPVSDAQVVPSGVVVAEVIPSSSFASPFLFYTPPLPAADLTVVHCVFLI